MIFTPRSCPSSPGFATSTRIFFSVILRCALCVSVTSVFRFRSFAGSKDISPYSFFQDWDVEIDEEAKPTVSQEKTRQRDGLVDGSRSAASEVRALTDSARCPDRKSTRLNSSHLVISYAVFCLKKKTSTFYVTE